MRPVTNLRQGKTQIRFQNIYRLPVNEFSYLSSLGWQLTELLPQHLRQQTLFQRVG